MVVVVAWNQEMKWQNGLGKQTTNVVIND